MQMKINTAFITLLCCSMLSCGKKEPSFTGNGKKLPDPLAIPIILADDTCQSDPDSDIKQQPHVRIGFGEIESDPYSEGYEEGADDGWEDGYLCLPRETNFDDISHYDGDATEEYEEGYEAGYEDGWDEGEGEW